MISTENSQGSTERRGWPSQTGAMLVLLAMALRLCHEAMAAEPSSPPLSSQVAIPKATTEGCQTTVRPRQILLDARVLEMKPRDLWNLGNWHDVSLCDDKSSTRGRAHAVKTNSVLSVQEICVPDSASTDSLRATMKHLREGVLLRDVANPQIIELDGNEALVRSLDGDWFLGYGRTKYTCSILGGSDVALKPGLSVSITPHAGDGNDITLDMAVEISDRGGKRNPDPNQETILRRTEVRTITVHTGGTIAWAGLMQYGFKEKRPSGLAGLPLIGGLFCGNKGPEDGTETVIVVTASLVR